MDCKRADWDKYKSVIEEKCEKIDNSTTEVSYSELLDWIDSAANSSIQINKVRNKTRRPMWKVFKMVRSMLNMGESGNVSKCSDDVLDVLVDKIAPPGVSYNIDEDLNGNEIDAYRPITLSSCIAKIKDRLIKRRLEWWLEHNKIFPRTQFGFRRKHSTMDNLSIFISDIYLAFSKNTYVVALFSDIKGAYDNVIPNILMDKLLKKIVLEMNDRKYERYLYKGLPQGGILSPLLYALYAYDLEKIWVPGTKILQYADDVVIYVERKTLKDALEIMTNNIDLYNLWLSKNGLTLSEEKSTIDYGSWIFSNSRKIQDLDKIQYRCLRICIGAMKSTPTNVLLLESGEMPLEIRRKLLCDKYILKNIINNESVLNYKLMEIWRSIDRSTYWINKKVPELIAIREAVRIAKMNKYKKTMILTDSLSCVNKLEKFMNTIEFEEKIYFEILNDIEIITGIGNNINIGWVQGHIGVEGNEKADELAKTASRRDGEEVWRETSQRKGRHYKLYNDCLSFKPWFEEFKNEERRFIVTISRIRTKHGSYAKHLHRIKVINSDICECGEEEGTLEHIILESILQVRIDVLVSLEMRLLDLDVLP
ncbi:uncharacterized protein LOC113376008 [Ctenocephalides felis]|uniref:uncharacterized protein LOC113376008 n=1 Tax=Ctenocephalides felis TaxID=7515 RepID=UPI000E6E29E7|nr:uncharacterized protein LOC113376008 [Ctenocephalides felis]